MHFLGCGAAGSFNTSRVTSSHRVPNHPTSAVFRVMLGAVPALALLLAACASPPPPKSQPSKLLQRVMPSFSSTSLNGTAIDTAGFDTPVVVKFFATDCQACERTLPAAQSLYSKKPNVVVIGVSEGSGEAETRQLVSKYKLRFPVVIDSDNSIARRFETKKFPMTFVADKQGRIRWVGGADLTEEALVSAVESVDE